MKEELKLQRALQKKIESYKGTDHYNNSKTGQNKLKRTLDLLSGTNPEVLTQLGVETVPEAPYKALNYVRSKDLKIVKNTEIFDLTGKGKLTGHHGTPASLLRALQVMDDDAKEYVFKYLADSKIKHGMDPDGILALDKERVHGSVAHGGDFTGKRTGASLEPIPGESGPAFIKRLKGAYNIQMDMNEKAFIDPLTDDWQGAMRGASDGLDMPDLDLNSTTTPSAQRTEATKILKPSAQQVRQVVQSNPGNPEAIRRETAKIVQNTPRTPAQNKRLLNIQQNYTPSPKSISPALRIGRALSFVPLLGIVDSIKNSANAAMKGDVPGAIAHGVGGAVGEIPLVGDAAVESVSGTPVADGTLSGHKRAQLEAPSYYGKKGPDLTTPEQNQRAQVLRKDPGQERGYETIQRVATSLRDRLKSLFK